MFSVPHSLIHLNRPLNSDHMVEWLDLHIDLTGWKMKDAKDVIFLISGLG